MSQPSWAAWIEISEVVNKTRYTMSQPSWAAWIEIGRCNRASGDFTVAALLGCVD